MRVELGVLTNGRLGTVEMVSEYIKHEQAEEVNTTIACVASISLEQRAKNAKSPVLRSLLHGNACYAG